jgi:hypothetical protein
MVGVFEWNVTAYGNEWFVPVADLVEIYKARKASSNQRRQKNPQERPRAKLLHTVRRESAGKICHLMLVASIFK